jgi:sigma-B regulation protein RsbU (phosphoserine phosphatase)
VILARLRTQLSLKRSVEEIRCLEQNLAQRHAELQEANGRIEAAYEDIKQNLRAAASVQRALLPSALPSLPGTTFAWTFLPCEELAGDILNVVPLGPDHVGLYVLDVSGHGVAAALLSVTLSRLLTVPGDATSVLIADAPHLPAHGIVAPAQVASALNQRFRWDPATQQYFTMLYGVFNSRTGVFRYAAAGHPGPVHVPAVGDPRAQDKSGLPIGIDQNGRWSDHVLTLQPGDRLYLYTDGVVEAPREDTSVFGQDRLLEVLKRGRAVSLQASVQSVVQALEEWCGANRRADDVSLLAVEYSGDRGENTASGRALV